MSHYFINPGDLGSGCSNWYVFHFPFFVPACLWNRRLHFNDILSRPFSLRGAQVAISGAAGKTNDDTVQYLSRRQSSVLTGRCTAWLLNVAVSLCDDGRRWRSLRVEVWLCVCACVCAVQSHPVPETEELAPHTYVQMDMFHVTCFPAVGLRRFKSFSFWSTVTAHQ